MEFNFYNFNGAPTNLHYVQCIKHVCAEMEHSKGSARSRTMLRVCVFLCRWRRLGHHYHISHMWISFQSLLKLHTCWPLQFICFFLNVHFSRFIYVRNLAQQQTKTDPNRQLWSKAIATTDFTRKRNKSLIFAFPTRFSFKSSEKRRSGKCEHFSSVS